MLNYTYLGQLLHIFFFTCRYLVTEGQVFVIFSLTYVFMLLTTLRETKRGYKLDINGQFLLTVFSVTLGLVAVWVGWLWNDPVLRARYPGFLYIPEPWAYYTLYIRAWSDQEFSLSISDEKVWDAIFEGGVQYFFENKDMIGEMTSYIPSCKGIIFIFSLPQQNLICWHWHLKPQKNSFSFP